MTAADRLILLLPMANGDHLTRDLEPTYWKLGPKGTAVECPKDQATLVSSLDEGRAARRSHRLTTTELRNAIFSFLHGFQAQGLRLQSGEHEMWDVHRAPEAELKAVAKKVQTLFVTGFLFDGTPGLGTEGIGPDDIEFPLAFPSLRFGAFAPGRERGRKASAHGRFELIVKSGRLQDLVPYLAMWLLTTEAITVSRCEAPAYRNWAERCNRFMIWGAVGRPPKVCSAKCAQRVKAKKVNNTYKEEVNKKQREALKAIQRQKSTQQPRRKKR